MARPAGRIAWIAFLLAFLLAACGDHHRAAVPGALDLPSAPPAQLGLDDARLQRLAAKAEDDGKLHGLLVVRHGVIGFERYFGRWGPDDLHEVQSISKGVVSLCVGVALDHGEIESLDAPIASYFPDLRIQNLDDRKRAITIGDVLRMSTGTDYTEGERGSPHWQLNQMDRGWTEFWLNRPMTFPPGEGWRYDSGGVIALSAVFQRTTGMHVDDYARRWIFEPLGIERYEWERNAEGHPHAGGGLHLRPRDLAKVGVLMLQHGNWQGRQVVPDDWIDRSTRIKFRFPAGNEPIVGYAYLWWVLQPDPGVDDGGRPVVAGTGLGGQYLFWDADRDLVVVVTGWSDDPKQASAPMHFLYDEILPAVTD